MTLPLTDWLLLALLLLPVVATLLPFYDHDHWSVRIFDFPRQQIAALSLIALLLTALLQRSGSWLLWIMVALNIGCALWQFWKICAYTRLRKPQVLAYHGEDNERTISIIASNVLTPIILH